MRRLTIQLIVAILLSMSGITLLFSGFWIAPQASGRTPYVMPNDHPHGGGEGKTGIGRPGPSTPWGKPALGLKTRKKNKQSNKLIVRRRDGKTIK